MEKNYKSNSNYNKNNLNQNNNENLKNKNNDKKYLYNKNMIQNQNIGDNKYQIDVLNEEENNFKNYQIKKNNNLFKSEFNHLNKNENNNDLNFKYDDEEELNLKIKNYSFKKDNKELISNIKDDNEKYKLDFVNNQFNNQEYQNENNNKEIPKFQNQNNKLNFMNNNNCLLDNKNFKFEEFSLKSYNQNEKGKDLNEIINELKEENLNLQSQNQILNVSLIQKDQLIDSLKDKISELENKIEKTGIGNNNNEYINEIKELNMEKEELFNQNQKLLLGINSFNERLKEINDIYDKKNESYLSEIKSYKEKLFEYKRKIILLKKKIDELYNERGQPNIISLLNYNKDYGNPIQVKGNEFKNKNFTPHRLEKKNSFTFRKKRNQSEGFIKFNIDNKENNLQKQQRQFIQDYQIFLNNLEK